MGRSIVKGYTAFLLSVLGSTAPSVAEVGSAIDRLEFLVPGLSAKLICSVPIEPPCCAPDPCVLPTKDGGTASFFIDGFSKGTVQIDGAGSWYVETVERIDCGGLYVISTVFYRFAGDYVLEPVLRVAGECRGETAISADYAITINPITGVAILDGDLREWSSLGLVAEVSEMIEVRDFPRIPLFPGMRRTTSP